MALKELSLTDYGLIGHPLGHSRSKAFFTEYFADSGSKESYDNFDLPALTPEALYSLVLLNPRLKGFNVTAPYKEEICKYLDRIDDAAGRVGAVNTVRIVRDATGRVLALEGFNADVGGFKESVEPMVKQLAAGSGALVLDTGGASKAVVEAFAQLGVPSLRVSRGKSGDGIIGYDDIDAALLEKYPLVVNATPAGTWPNVDTAPPFPYHLFKAGMMAHDLVYNPEETKFLRLAREAGALTKNGLEMLHRQAMLSLGIWRQ